MWNESMIKSFLILADVSSFTEAAHRTFFSQQAISKQISSLESTLGCQLVVRERNNIHLTPEGEIYCQAFRQAMDLINAADNQVATIKARQGGQIHLGYLEMLIVDPVWDAYIREYNRRFPNIQVVTESYSDLEVFEGLMNNKLDVVITFYEEGPEEQGLECIPLGKKWSEKFCISRNYPGAAEARSYHELENVPVFLPAYDMAKGKRRAAEIGIADENVRYTPNIASALQNVMMLKGGIIVGEHIFFKDNPDLLFFDLDIAPRPPVLLWKKDNPNRALRILVEQFCIFAANWQEKREISETEPAGEGEKRG